jgi:hypothetical protein
VRRRRDEAADAPSSGSRVILCSLHHAAPADERTTGIAVLSAAFLPGPSVVKQRRCSGRRSRHRRRVSSSSCSAGETQNAPPAVCGAGGACRTAPIRWSMAMRYGASPRNPDPAPLCPALSDRYPLVLHDASWAVVCCFRSLGRAMLISRVELPTSIHVACIPVPIAPTGARQLAANRLSPACRGRANRSWVCAVMGSSVRVKRVSSCSDDSRNAKVAPPMIARRVVHVGVGPTHTPAAWCIDS